jgi:hypothetical protein
MRALPTIAVITQETRLKGLQSRWATKSAAHFRLKQAHAVERDRVVARAARAETEDVRQLDSLLECASFASYEEEDLTYQQTLDLLKRELDLGYPVKFVNREFLPNFDFRGCVLVVVVGQDGLVANAAKYVGDLPIVGVNPDPKRIDGVLVPFHVRQIRRIIQQALDDRADFRSVTLAEVNLNDGQRMLAFNDFFVGCQSHVSARYTLRVGGKAEPQSSSGIIISTGAGSTGWLSSIFNMAAGFAKWMGRQMPAPVQLEWNDRRLVWVVREPFRSKQSGAKLVAGLLEEGQDIVVESLMPTRGVIFSDGIESDFLEFQSGTIASFSAAPQRARLVVG